MFWKDHQHQFPALANLARDVLSIPATGAGVERLFNSARDVCHYRRGSLKPSTIQDLMMFMCTSKFEIEEGQRALINEYLLLEEVQANQEAKDLNTPYLEPISDNEEIDDALLMTDTTQTAIIITESQQQQPSSIGPEIGGHEEEGEPDLPNTQSRHSGRVRKRSRLLEGYES
jgi:hypothetical protein